MESIKLNIPTSWDDITIGQFVELQPVLNSELSLIKKVNAVLSVLSGTPVDDLANVVASENNIKAYRKISEKLQFLNDTSTMEEVKKTFKVGGKRYAIDLNIEAMDAGQYISFMEILKRSNSDPKEALNHTHEILACMIKEVKGVPLFRRYDNDPTKFRQRANLFYNELPISIAYPITVFFCKVYQDYTTSFGELSIAKVEEVLQEAERDLMDFGDGL